MRNKHLATVLDFYVLTIKYVLTIRTIQLIVHTMY